MTTYYVDPSVASATASTNSAAPGNSIKNALTAATGADDSILLARGYVYKKDTSFYENVLISGKTPATRLLLSSYVADSLPNATARPLINGMTFEPPSGATGWTLVSGSIWKKAFPAPAATIPWVRRVFAGAQITGGAANMSLGTDWVVGLAQRRAAVVSSANEAALLAAIDSTSTWGWTSADSGVLYMYSSPTQDPPTYYGGLGLVGGYYSGTPWGNSIAVGIRNSSNITLDGVDMLSGSGSALTIMSSTAASDNIKILNCDLHCASHKGMDVYGASGFLVTRGYAYNVRVIAQARLEEDWNTDPSAVDDWTNGPNDNISVRQYVEGFMFEDCESYDGHHSNFALQPDPASYGTTKNVVFRGGKVDCRNRKYGRALAWKYTHDAEGNGFYRINVRNCCQLFQGWGRITIRDIVARDFSMTYDAWIGPNNVMNAGMPGMGFFWGDDYTPTAGAMKIQNVTMDNPRWYPIFIYKDTGLGAPAAGAVEMTNVVINDTEYRTARERAAGVPQPTRTIYYQNSDGSMFDLIKFTNCLIDSGPDNGSSIVMNQDVGTFTYSTLAALTGASGNLEETAELDANLRPASGTSNVVEAGVHVGYTVDVAGNQHWNPPTIGAYEYQRARTARDLPTA